MHRARIALLSAAGGCGFFMTRLGLCFRGRFRRVRNAALLRHERRQRRDLAEEPGKRHRAHATPDCGHAVIRVAETDGPGKSGYDVRANAEGVRCLAGIAACSAGLHGRKSADSRRRRSPGPTPPVPTPPLPTTVPGVLTIAHADRCRRSRRPPRLDVAPFGYHGADHAEDGHPGWDIEYRIGGIVRAAAAGTVQSVVPDPFTPAASPSRSNTSSARITTARSTRTSRA